MKEKKKIKVTAIVIVNGKEKTTLNLDEARALYEQLGELFDKTITSVPYPSMAPYPVYIRDDYPRWWVGDKGYSTTDAPIVYCRKD